MFLPLGHQRNDPLSTRPQAAPFRASFTLIVCDVIINFLWHDRATLDNNSSQSGQPEVGLGLTVHHTATPAYLDAGHSWVMGNTPAVDKG